MTRVVNNTVYHLSVLEKEGTSDKDVLKQKIEAPLHTVLGFQEDSMQSLYAFKLFFGFKKGSKSSMRKRQTLRLLSKCLGKSTPPFSVMKDNSSVSFQLKHLYFVQKAIFRLLNDWVKIHQIPNAMFSTKSQFFFKLCITLQYHVKLT